MCNFPWSNRDFFQFVDDCHIYQPVHIFLSSCIIICSFFTFLYGCYETKKRTQKDLPLSCICLGIFFFLNYIIMLSLDVTLSDRILWLNTLHALARATLWVVVGLHSFKTLQVIIYVDKHMIAESKNIDQCLTFMNNMILIISCITEIIVLIIPNEVTSLYFIDILAPAGFALMYLNSIPRTLYAYKLRKIILSIKTTQNEDYYLPIQKQLENVFKQTAMTCIVSGVIVLCSLFVYPIRTNLYIAYNFQMIGAPLSGISCLHTTRGTSRVDDGLGSKTNGSTGGSTGMGSGSGGSRNKLDSSESKSNYRTIRRSTNDTGSLGTPTTPAKTLDDTPLVSQIEIRPSTPASGGGDENSNVGGEVELTSLTVSATVRYFNPHLLSSTETLEHSVN